MSDSPCSHQPDSSDCQKADWKTGHKTMCKEIKGAIWTTVNISSASSVPNVHGAQPFIVHIQQAAGRSLQIYDPLLESVLGNLPTDFDYLKELLVANGDHVKVWAKHAGESTMSFVLDKVAPQEG